MQTAADLVRANHPHMSDGLIELMSLDAQAYVGVMAKYCMEQKTAQAVKQLLAGFIKMGEAAQFQIDAYNERAHSLVAEMPKPPKGGRRGRRAD